MTDRPTASAYASTPLDARRGACYHVMRLWNGVVACRAMCGAIVDDTEPLMSYGSVPAELRCQRPGCAQAWEAPHV